MAVVVVVCLGEDHGDVTVAGPFADYAWAAAWLKQHSNNAWEELSRGQELSEDEFERREADMDHWCYNGFGLAKNHLTMEIHLPGFDPTTTPGSLEEEDETID